MDVISFERWLPSQEDPRKTEYAGQRSAFEVFEELCERLENMGCLPDEYFLLDRHWEQGKEIPKEAEIYCTVDYGESEGIYLDAYLTWYEDSKKMNRCFATGKTLGETGVDLDRMHLIASAITKAFYGDHGTYARFVPLGELPSGNDAILCLTAAEQQTVIEALLQMRERSLNAVDSTEQLLRRLTGSITGFTDLTGARPLRLMPFEKAMLAIQDGELDVFRNCLPQSMEHRDELLAMAASRRGRVGDLLMDEILKTGEHFSMSAYLKATKKAVETGDMERVLSLMEAAQNHVKDWDDNYYGQTIQYAYNANKSMAIYLAKHGHPEWVAAIPVSMFLAALRADDTRFVEVLASKGIHVENHAMEAFQILADRDEPWEAEYLLRLGLDVSVTDYPLLNFCMQKEWKNVIALLLQRGFDLEGYTAWAREQGGSITESDLFREFTAYWASLQKERANIEDEGEKSGHEGL